MIARVRVCSLSKHNLGGKEVEVNGSDEFRDAFEERKREREGKARLTIVVGSERSRV